MYGQADSRREFGKMLPTLQGKFYQRTLQECSGMAKEHIEAALQAFSRNAKTMLGIRGIESDAELWRRMNKKLEEPISPKTVNNVLAGRYDARMGTLEAIAGTLDCPLWVLLHPGIVDADLQSPARERLIAAVKSYLACDDEHRSHLERIAAAYAAMHNKP